MAKHAVKDRKRQECKRKKPTGRASRVSAISAAGVLAGGMVLSPFSHSAELAVHKVLADVLLSAGSIIFIDGNNYPNHSERMAGQLSGQYQYQACSAAGCVPLATPLPQSDPNAPKYYFINNTSVYPGTLGLYNGLGAPSGDVSIADGQAALHNQITSSQTPVTVVGYSEGAVAASHEVSAVGPGKNVSFVLIADAERPNGGLLARMPAGTYIPLLGITGGSATSSTGAPVVMVTQQYDGVADAPAYPLNVVADANAVLGFVYLHSNYYTVDPNGSGTVVTQSANMTDILVLAPVGELPILMPLAQAGVPQPILVALDPAFRAVIETGYARSSDPSQQVRFALLPPVSALPGDATGVVVGFVTTAQQLPGAMVASVPGGPTVVVLTPMKTNTPVSPPSTVKPSTETAPLEKTQVVSNVTPTPHVKSETVSDTTSGTDVVQQLPADSPKPPPKASLPDPAPSSTGATKRAETGTLNQRSPNKFFPTDSAGTSTGSGTSSNASNPIQGAMTGVANAIGSVTSSLAKAAAGASTAAHSGN
ncbi:MAG: hypothetical protein QOE41_3133 [Mycobacterium sp.]|nr:hypothetical protein [Mycobacterium sp.]